MSENHRIRALFVWLIPIALLFPAAGCNGKSEDGQDADAVIDGEDDRVDMAAEEIDEDAPEDIQDIDVDGADEIEEEVVSHCGNAELDEGEECDNGVNNSDSEPNACRTDCRAPWCGDGVVDDRYGEVCDDGNTETEYCGRGEDCLGDCSLLAANCGNGELDPGEECDDGNFDSYDDCTTSCTVNDHNIGAPCRCEGPECTDQNFSAGNIIGCENVEIPPGSGGVLSCVRSIDEAVSGYRLYFAEGECSIDAMTCEGPAAICDYAPQYGDLDTFQCPAGYVEDEMSVTIFDLAVITQKYCCTLCTSPAQCRWNAYDDFWDECGQVDCLPLPSDPSVSICMDPRNFEW